MKVLQINTVCGQGSTGVIAVEIARMLTHHGDEAFVAYGHGSTDYQPSFKITTTGETRINARVFSAILGRQDRGLRCGTRGLLRWMDIIKPDIVHLHNLHGLYLHYPMLINYLNKRNIPVVWTLHDCWAMTGNCAHFSSAGCQKWKVLCEHCTYHGEYKTDSLVDTVRTTYKLKKKLFTSLRRVVLVPVSRWLGNLVAESFLKELPVQVIHNGIDLTVFRPMDAESLRKSLGIPADKKILLGVSSQWNEAKGLSEMVRLSENEEWQVVLVGNLGKENIPDPVIHLPRVENKSELAALYSLADVFVNPSYNDTFPTVHLEALACGTPVVSYDSDGCPETLDASTGRLVPRGNEKMLTEAVREVLSCGKGHYSSACVARAARLYEKGERFAEYYRLYQQLLSSK